MWYASSNRISNRRLGRSGSVALEFGLVSGIFFMILMACIDLGRYYATWSSLHTVLGDAMRAASIDPSFSGCDTPKQKVAANAPFLAPSQLGLCVTQNVSSGMTTITVTATYPFTFTLPKWVGFNGTLTDQSTASFASSAG